MTIVTNNKHKTKNIIIEEADVDIGMIPLVDWLNKQEGINTVYCCEGDVIKTTNYNINLNYNLQGCYILFRSYGMQTIDDLSKFIYPLRIYLFVRPCALGTETLFAIDIKSTRKKDWLFDKLTRHETIQPLIDTSRQRDFPEPKLDKNIKDEKVIYIT